MRFSSLSKARQHLVRKTQGIKYGSVHNLIIRGGEPQFFPPPTIRQVIKLHHSENGPRQETHSDDFLLKDEVVELMRQLDVMRDGVITKLEVKGGLPFTMTVDGTAAE
jgi:hypothetical protein